MIRPLVRERHKLTNPQLSKENLKEKEKLVTGHDDDLTPGQTGRLPVGRKMTLTLTLTVQLILELQSVTGQNYIECTVSWVLLWLWTGTALELRKGNVRRWKPFPKD
jgi:hypothetical protein